MHVFSHLSDCSTHIWEDELGDPQMILQGEGGEQGDPLMPLLFSLGQHSALDAVISRLQEGERLFAFLDDLYILCDPGRVAEVHTILEEELWRHARIQIHQGKTKIWNKGGFVPAGWEDLEAGARMLDPNAIVWRGNADIPSAKEGLKILGCPVGHPDFVQDQLSKFSDRHDALLDRIAMVEDLQSAWLLLVYCAAARANFFLRSVSPGQISTFASHRDDQIWACLCTLLGVDPASVTHSSRIGATLPLRHGGLGLSSAVRLRYAAHWASWADCIRMVHQRHPSVARTIIEAVEANDPAQTAQGVVSSINSLRSAVPSWDDLIRERPNQGPVEEEDPSQPRFGRQKDAAVVVHKVFLEEELRPLLDEPEEALALSGWSPRFRPIH